MTTRSRTSLFLSYRNSRPRSLYHDNNDENEQLITASHLVIDLPDLPPTWSSHLLLPPPLLTFTFYIGSILQTKSKSSFWILTQRVFFFSIFPFFCSLRNFLFPVAYLDKLHAKHVLPGFSDRSHEEREIEALTTDITKVRSSFSFLHLSHFSLSQSGFSSLSVSYQQNQCPSTPCFPSGSQEVEARGPYCQERSERPCRQSSGPECCISKKAACLHGKLVILPLISSSSPFISSDPISFFRAAI
jgi:hypothetical protein